VSEIESDGKKCGFVVVLGPTNAGKSSLMNRLMERKISIVSERPQTTRDAIRGILTRKDYQIIFVDTPGAALEGRTRRLRNRALLQTMNDERQNAAHGADVSMVVFDALSCVKSENYLKNSKQALRDDLPNDPEVIVLNKIDTIGGPKSLPLILKISELFPTTKHIIPASAVKGIGITDIEKTLSALIPESEYLYPEEMVTDQTREFLIQERIRERVFRELHQEIPFSVGVKVVNLQDEEVDGKKHLYIETLLLVERDSQKGILIGKHGSMLERIGTMARKELEYEFGCTVMLQQTVSVESDWTETERGVQRMKE
jgi:GTPase